MSTRLTSSFLRTTEAAAIAAARTTGQGTGEHSDHLAVEAMRKVMAQIMGLDMSRVSIKATTSEKLGFTGRGEGIAAQATAMVQFG